MASGLGGIKLNNMEITLILIAYILSVFLNRWLNYIIFKKYSGTITPIIWFFSIMATVVLLLGILIMIIQNFDESNWFTGKYWDKK